MAPRDRLISDEAAEAALMRGWIRPDAERLAASYWWGRQTLHGAHEELRGIAILKDVRAGGLACKACDVADEELADALDAHERAHAESLRLMTQAALGVIRQDGTYRDAARAAADVARGRPLLPPAYLIRQAVEEAAVEYRRGLAFWRKRERAG